MGIKHLLHVRSNSVINGEPKLPTSDVIEYGELAVNYAKDNETLSLKNSNNDIVALNIHKVNKFMEEGGGGGKTYTNGDDYIDVNNTNDTISFNATKLDDYVTGITIQSGTTNDVTKNGKSRTITYVPGKTYTSGDNLVKVDNTANTISLTSGYVTGGTITPSAQNKVEISNGQLNISFVQGGGDIQETCFGTVDQIEVNGKSSTKVSAPNGKASVTISGSDVNVGDYTAVQYPASFSGKASNVSSTNTIASAFTNVEKTISALSQDVNSVSGAVSGIDANYVSGITLNSNKSKVYTPVSHVVDIPSITLAASSPSETQRKIALNVDGVEIASTSFSVQGGGGEVQEEFFGNVTGVTVNGVKDSSSATGSTGLTITISGSDTNVGTYTAVQYPASFSGKATNVSGTDTVATAFNSVEKTISALSQDFSSLSLSSTTSGNDTKVFIKGADGKIGSEVTISTAGAEQYKGTVDQIKINDKESGKVTAPNGEAIITISGTDINVGTYTAVQHPQVFEDIVKDYKVKNTNTISSAFTNVETQVSGLTQELIKTEEVFANAIEKLAIAIGNVLDDNGKIVYVNNDIDLIRSASSHNEAITLLANAITIIQSQITAINTRLGINS